MLPLLLIQLVSSSEHVCEEVEVPMCASLGYNQTDVKLSPFDLASQKEAGMEIYTYYPLVQISCAEELRPFLCSYYSPICMENYEVFVPPCKFICEAAKVGCLPFMRKLGFSWPDKFDCDALPDREDGSNILCLDFNMPKRYIPPVPVTTPDIDLPDVEIAPASSCCNNCQYPSFVSVLNPSAKVGQTSNCAMPCRSSFLRSSEYFEDQSSNDESIVEYWLMGWTIGCLAVSCVTCLTFIINPSRVEYPERPIVYLAFCYLLISVGYLLRVVAGHEKLSCDAEVAGGQLHAVLPGEGQPLCLFNFLFTYFFWMAASLWWVCLCFTWFLAAALKWSKEAIQKHSHHFQLLSWGIPAVKTVIALTTGSIEGDNVSGMCVIGATNTNALKGFILIPLIIYLACGAIFLSIGFVSLFKIRSSIRKSSPGVEVGDLDLDKLEKLIIKIAVFSLLYTFPAALHIGAQFYESWWRSEATKQAICDCDIKEIKFGETEIQVILLRYSMNLIPGIGAGIWICTPKTLKIWKSFLPCGKKIKRRSNGISSVPLTGAPSIVKSQSSCGIQQSESQLFVPKPV